VSSSPIPRIEATGRRSCVALKLTCREPVESSFGVRLESAAVRGGVEPPDSENRGYGAAVWAVDACFNRFASYKSSGVELARAVDVN
jgi:hypothetical protein